MANRFWVGGTGTWDASSTANWSATTGGASGASAPVAADVVFFDANSGTGTCTTAAGATCTSATLNTSTLGLTLGDNLTMAGTFTLTLGALDLGSNTLTCNVFSSSNANVRSIAFGTGAIELTGNAVQILTMNNATNFTYTGTPNINATYTGGTGTRTINFGSSGGAIEANAPNLNITAGTDIVTLQSTNTAYKNLNFTGFAGSLTFGTFYVYGNLTISSGMTLPSTTSLILFLATSGTQLITTNGKTLDFNVGNGGVGNNVQLQDNLTMGASRTYTLTNGILDLNNFNLSAGIFSSTNSNVRSIAFGTGKISLAGNAAAVWSMANATNFTHTGTTLIEFTYAGSTGTRQIFFGTSAGSTTTNVLNFSVTAGSDIVEIRPFANSLDFTGFSGSLANSARNLSGSLTLSSTMTLTAGTAATTFVSTSAGNTITSNGQTMDFPIGFGGLGGVWAFQDALTQGSTRAFTFANGTIQLKDGVTSTVGAFATSGTNQKFLQSTTLGSQATLSQASGTVNATNLTIQDINATGGATWNALWSNNNVDLGNNTGWFFGDQPVTNAVEYTYKIRSFTQPRRF
jgi:hypothetical protein